MSAATAPVAMAFLIAAASLASLVGFMAMVSTLLDMLVEVAEVVMLSVLSVVGFIFCGGFIGGRGFHSRNNGVFSIFHGSCKGECSFHTRNGVCGCGSSVHNGGGLWK